jgi:hypothetical protein
MPFLPHAFRPVPILAARFVANAASRSSYEFFSVHRSFVLLTHHLQRRLLAAAAAAAAVADTLYIID